VRFSRVFVTEIAQKSCSFRGVGGLTPKAASDQKGLLLPVTCTLETTRLDDDTWTWPSIRIVGVSGEGEYEAISEIYAELGELLMRLARRRQKYKRHATAERRMSSTLLGDPASDDLAWLQLTLVEGS